MTISDALRQRVLLLDGAMGTQIQTFGLTEADFRGSILADSSCELAGNNDLLVLTWPDVIADIHRSYLEAGTDIITTCSFNAQRISQAEYGTAHLVRDINLAAARIARNAADAFSSAGRPRFVAGSVGPTTKLLAISDDAADPAARSISFALLESAYIEQMAALIEGGVDALLIETVLDPVNCKAAVSAAVKAMDAVGRQVPIMVSATVTDSRGRLLSAQDIEAFVIALSQAPLLSIGLNCSLGADGLLAPLRRLSAICPVFVSAHPNAGLPNRLGAYDDTPEIMTAVISRYLADSLVNIVGGCCGTTPAHIAAFRAAIDASTAPIRVPAPLPEPSPDCWHAAFSGLEPLVVDGFFVNVGERCNVAGSRKFLRLISEGRYAEAIDIARRQVDDGAMVIDINMDDGLLDAPAQMVTFLRLLSAEPDIAKVPVMVDSSDFAVVVAALENMQGKGIVNSISLKDGEEEFLRKGAVIKRLGAAVIVMAFDEDGQATDFAGKTRICARAYRLLTEKAGFNPADIIFDPNILTVATGIDEHLDYAHDFVRATRWIRQNLPGAGVSGGVSNLSFAFRGNNAVREAMHAVFLYHAVQAGLTMAIINPSTSVTYDSVDPVLREAIEAVLFTERTPEAVERLTALAASLKAADAAGTPGKAADSAHDAPQSVDERLRNALIKGNPATLEADLAEALASSKAVDIIAGPLMDGMNAVGAMFADGRMFLPQVVKTARTMKLAVEFLKPYMGAADEAAPKAGKMLMATVKGDVHDIGKNIAGVVMACNNYSVVDLGVMVPPERIVEAVLAEKPDFVGLSGLITPSLDAMVTTARMMADAGITVPLMIGGAATSPMHTALKIAPVYPGTVVHVADAAANPIVAASLLGPDADAFKAALADRYSALAAAHSRAAAAPKPSCTCCAAAPAKEPPFMGLRKMPLVRVGDLLPFISWPHFFRAWRTDPASQAGGDLRADADALLAELAANPDFGMAAAVRFSKAHAADGCIVLADGTAIPAPYLASFVNKDADYVGMFVVTHAPALRLHYERIKSASDSYAALLLQTVLDRLAAAASEWLHSTLAWDTIRPAVGYPSLPDHAVTHIIAPLLGFSDLGIAVTESGAMYPQATVAGLYIANPDAKYL